jgi:small-conductance mechanosensitive channel
MKRLLLVALVACLGLACVQGGKVLPEAPTPSAPSSPAAAPVQGAPSAGAASPVALEASEVPGKAMAAETRLRALRSLASRTRETASIAAALPGRLEAIDRLAEWTGSRTPRQQTPRALRSLSQEWGNHADVLRDWMDTIGRRLNGLNQAHEEIRALETTWNATEEKLASTGGAPEIVERARSVFTSTRELAAALRERIDENLLLQNRISGKLLDAEEALDAIDADLREERKVLLVIESPPLWKALATAPESGWILSEIGAALSESRRAVRQYAEQAGGRILGQLLLLAALVALFYRLKRRIGAWPMKERGVRACASVVGHPLMGASLVALFLTREFHPRAPLAFDEVVWLLTLPPLLAVMTGVVTPRMRAPLWALAGLFAIERIWELTWAGSVLERLVLLGMTVISAGVLFWTIYPGKRAAEGFANRWWRAMTFAGRIGLAALSVSVFSNLLGNVTLARLLTSTVVRSAYLAVSLYAVALVLRGTLTLFLASGAGRSIRTLARHEELIRNRAGIAIDLLAVGWWTFRVLSMTGFGSVLLGASGGLLNKQWGIGAFRFSFGTALVFLAAVYASVLLSRLIRVLLEEDVFPRVDLPRGVPGTLTMLIRYGVITVGFLLAAAVAGIPLDRLTIVFGALSVGIGFGLQTIVNNFVSGLILMFERPIQVGDTVEVGGLLGRVRTIGVRASTIETFDGAEVIVPNGTLVSDQLINWTLSNRNRRIEVQVGVAYGTDPAKVMSLLRDAALSHPSTLAEPEPFAIFRAHGDSALTFSLLFWTSDFDNWLKAKSDVTVRVDALLREAGIEIPFPQRDVRIRS